MDDGNSPLPDILNDIFLLDLDWDYRGDATLRKGDLLAFRDLCRELQKHLMRSEFHSAVWFLTQARYFVRGELPVESLFRPLNLTLEQKRKIASLLSRGSDLFLQELTRIVSAGMRLPELVAEQNTEQLFAAFLAAEKHELRTAGLNQRSVSIVLNRLEAHKEAIIKNVGRDRSVIQNVLSKNLVARYAVSTTGRNLWRRS